MKNFNGKAMEMKMNHGLHRLAARGALRLLRSSRFALTRPDRFAAGASMLACLGMLLCGAANAATVTATTEPFRLSIWHNDTWYPRTAAASEAISYSSAWATNALTGANAVVKVYPVKRNKPKYIAIDLSGGTAATHYPIEYLEDVPDGGWTDEYKTSKLVLRHIPAGSFIMGGRETDYPGAVNTNLHMVTLTKDFYMGVFEVTQRQWELVMGNRPSAFSNETCYATRPVEMVSYVDIRGGVKGTTWPNGNEVDDGSFMGVLRRKAGLSAFDLPTEAQWEYACRAGTTTALNTGKNLSDMTVCAEMGEAGRYSDNSGWYSGCMNTGDFPTSGVEWGTAIVGTYLANHYGLYDMHGNVNELCLDVWSETYEESIDPIGPRSSNSGEARRYRGGGWGNNKAYLCISGARRFNDIVESRRDYNVGFRLCLQGGEIPEAAEGVTLVNAAGEGTANWTQTKAGTYYLTHETQTNGVNGAELLGAWFEVAGPELTIEPQGELTNGVAIAINGAGDGWTVYYTTDGSEPTSSSTLYEGAFSLPYSATVRAVAISAGGISSDEVTVSLTLHPPLAIDGVVARQRWPWNGMVDIDATVAGDPAKNYIVTLTALHTGGSTNLPIRTAWVDGGSVTNSTFVLAPGQYRFTWNADADIADDFNFGEVEFGVSVTGGALTDYAKKLTLTVDGYAGTETLTNVPVLVRLSTAIAGFSYADFADANGGDLIFTDEAETTVYPHEIDEWHTDGESLVWVKLPQMAHGTKFKMAYGGALGDRALPSHSVWNDYAGVWHMNEDSGTAFDSTVHGLDALPSCGTNGTAATMAQMVAYENGACGRARVNSLKLPGRGNDRQNFMLVPSYDGLDIGGRFVISGWFNGEYWNDGTSWSPRLISRKKDSIADSGWEICYRETFITVSDDSSTSVSYDIPGLNSAWVHLSVVYDGASCVCYTNGVSCGSRALSIESVDNGTPLAFGNTATGSRWSFIGQYDEIRLRGGSLSADRIKADYDMIVNREFISFAAALNESGLVPAVSATDTATLDVRHDGIRQSVGDETLTYSSQWDGGEGATVTIAQDGTALVEGLTGEGERAWSVTRNGTYVLTHTTYTNGVAGKAETATFVVTGKDVPFAVGDVTVADYSAKYDGAAHGITVGSEIDGFTAKHGCAPDGEFAAEPPMLTDVGTMTVWCEISAPGYITQTNSATVTILPREVTLTSGGASKVYDGTPVQSGDVLITGDGFISGEGATFNVTGSQTAVGTSANTFAYTLNDGTKAGNYDITTVNGTLTVTKATVGPGGGGGDEPGDGEVPQGGESKFDATAMYDGEGHTIDTNALTAAFGAAMIGEIAVEYAVDDGSGEDGHAGRVTLPWFAESPVYTNAGEYVVWYRVSNPNYEDFIHAAKVTITNRPVTVTVVGHTATYGYDTTEKGVAGYDIATADALYDIAADTAFRGGVIDAALPAAVRTDVGTTAMGLTAADFANSDANFLVTYAVTDGWVKVEPRVIGDDPANWDIRLARNPMYDGTLQAAPITQVAFVKPDGNLDNIPYTLSGNTATDAGNYVVRITGTGNYSGTVEKEWAITPRNVALTSGGAEWVYDGTAHSETAVTVGGDGFADGEGASYSGFPVVRHVADAAVPTANAFTYTLNANTKAGNYSITTANGTVKMLPRAITLAAPTKSKPYDGSALTFGAAEVTAVLNGDGGALGERALPEGEAFTLGSFASITEAGRVDATFMVSDGTALTGDYAITTMPGSLTVTRSATEITVTAKSGSWTYDGQPHSLHEYEATNLGTLQAGDALEVTFGDASVVTTPLDGPEGNGVVANVITGVRVIRGGADDVTANYTLAPYNGTLTVTRRPVTLTSGSASKPYDGAPVTCGDVLIAGDGFVPGEGATFNVTGSQTEKGTSKNTFAYTLKSGTNAAYYDITKVEGDLEVTAADISTGDEGDWQITFGPALTYTGLEQIQTLASVSYKGLPLDYSVTGNAQTDAGTYQMTLTGQGNFSGTHQVAWSIAPRALTLTAGSGSRVYDGTTFTVGAVTASGFVAGEGAEYTCDGSQKDVGSSANEVGTISWNTNTKASNYAVTKEAGTLTVTPRPVTLTAANLSKPYDGTPLALTAADIAASGIVAGESFTYSDFASRTEAGQTPATFSYAAGPGTSLANYSVTVTAGRMITITKSATAISVTAASGSWVYDAEAHSNRTWTATNLSTLQAGDELEVTFDEASVVTTPQDGPAQDGVVANVITGVRVLRSSGGPQSLAAEDVTANYSVEWFPGTLAVTKRPVTVTVTGRTATYTYDGEEKSVTGYDAMTADTLYDIAADTAFGGIATTNRTDAGKSDMGLKASDFTNNDDCFDVTYAVADGWVKIDPLDIAAADGGDFALVLGANPKYNGTVQTIPLESVTCGGLPVTYTLAGENATHAGTYTLTVKANGNFTGERSTTWQVLKRAVTLTSGSASKVYDGTPLANPSVAVGGDGFIGIEGATFVVTGSQTVAGTGKNTFAYTLKAGTLAGDYDITKVEGDLVVTKASTGGEGGDEPGGGEVPQGGESKFDTTFVYDGEGHTIDTNALTAAFGAAIIGESAVAYAADDGSANGGPGAPALPWLADAPAYTNAGEYVVWYRVSNPNYEDFIHAAKVTVTNRPVTVTSADGSWTYDGQAHSNATVTAEGFVDGEGIVAGGFAEIVDVGTAANAFTYVFADGTLAENYAVTCVTGTLTVAAAGIDGWTDDAKWSATLSGDGAKYDGMEKTCEVTALAYDGFVIPTFTVTGNTATDAGDYTLTVTGTGNFSGSHTFPWSITKREVTLTSGDASKVYDGIALTNHTVSVSGDGFASGEGASCEYTGSQTNVGTSENAFTYTLNEGTKAGNYDITTVNGTLTVTPATLNPADVFGGDAIETPLVCEKVFNGAAQPVEITPNFDEPYQFLWALAEGNENAYSATAPTLRNVTDGELTAFFKFVTANYQPYYGKVVFRILAKELTDEMVQLTDEAFFFDPDSGQKTPSVTVADTNALGVVISTAADYDVAYGDSTSAGAVPVTVTAKNNYTGTVTKTFPVLKRPVAPPVIGTKAYNGRTQKATVTTDSRWTVVRNNGGVDVGEYEVVLRLTNPEDYRWKGVDEAEAEWTGVFRITKANNGWSRYPGMTGWTYGETPNEPVMGQARYGTVQVAYRRKGTDASTETATKPSTPGTYIARFWVDETENHIGVALSTPYEVEFTIAPGAGGFTETQTTPVPVPYVWLDPYLAKYGAGDYEAAGKAKGRNGVTLWESYVAGLDPEEPMSKFTAAIELLPNGTVKITWSPDLSNAEKPRTYTTLGKAKLTDKDWVPVTDANKPQMRFFRVKVEIK